VDGGGVGCRAEVFQLRGIVLVACITYSSAGVF